MFGFLCPGPLTRLAKELSRKSAALPKSQRCLSESQNLGRKHLDQEIGKNDKKGAIKRLYQPSAFAAALQQLNLRGLSSDGNPWLTARVWTRRDLLSTEARPVTPFSVIRHFYDPLSRAALLNKNRNIPSPSKLNKWALFSSGFTTSTGVVYSSPQDIEARDSWTCVFHWTVFIIQS